MKQDATLHSTTASPPATDLASRWWDCLFENSEEPQFICRRDGVIAHHNRKAAALCEHMGVPVENLFSILPVSIGERLKTNLERSPTRPELYNTIMLAGLDGKNQVVDLQVTPLDDDHYMTVLRDASRRFRLESHVQRLMTAIDATPDLFLIMDSHFRICFVNPSFHDATGYTIEEAIGMPITMLRAPTHMQSDQEYRQKVLQGIDWLGELVNVRKNGTSFPVESVISPIYDHRGEFFGAVACERDVTIKKQLQKDLLSEKDLLQSIINSLDSATYTLDQDWHLTHYNEGWKKFPAAHGWLLVKEEPRLGADLLELVPESQRRLELEKIFAEVKNSGQSQEHRVSAADGMHWLVRVSPWWHHNQISGLIYHVTDQTRYHELQEQLFQAQKMEIVGTMAAGVAHDFNNLLQAIRGNVSLLQMDPQLADGLRHRLDQIEEATIRATEISRQLLEFSRTSDQQSSVIEFNHIIRDATQLARRFLKNSVKIELNPHQEPLKVSMDATRAHQLLLNLCVNAQDAMMPAGGQLVVSNTKATLTEEQQKKLPKAIHGSFMRCSIADNGQGMPPEVLARIFEPFFTTKEKGKGTGLGLAIAQRIMNDAGGFIEVESRPGIGTTFHLFLPLVDAAISRPYRAARAPLAKSTGKVMVVDDMDLVREFTESFLRKAGFTVHSASNGQAALDILLGINGDIDVLLTDFEMPGMTGLDLINEVALRWPRIKLLLVSGYVDQSLKKKIQEYGANIINKPFTIADAVRTINTVMSNPGPQDEKQP